MENKLFDNRGRSDILNQIAELLQYPGEDYQEILKKLVETNTYTEAVTDIEMFHQLLGNLNLGDLQELYTATFELNSKCSLYVGPYIFGDDTFKRGILMARFREAYTMYGIEEKSELPDFLPLLLKLSTKLDDYERLIALINECIEYPVIAMKRKFEESGNPYKYLIGAVLKIIEVDMDFLNKSNLAEINHG